MLNLTHHQPLEVSENDELLSQRTMMTSATFLGVTTGVITALSVYLPSDSPVSFTGSIVTAILVIAFFGAVIGCIGGLILSLVFSTLVPGLNHQTTSPKTHRPSEWSSFFHKLLPPQRPVGLRI